MRLVVRGLAKGNPEFLVMSEAPFLKGFSIGFRGREGRAFGAGQCVLCVIP